MAMVSVWALDTPLTVRLSPVDSKPMLTVSQAATGEPRRAATFLVVLSNHIAGKVSTAADVAAALYQTARWGDAPVEAGPFFQKVELPENFLEGLPSSKRKMKVKNLRLLTDSNSNAKLQRYKILKDKFAREYIKE
jgi:hypothetical protein